MKIDRNSYIEVIAVLVGSIVLSIASLKFIPVIWLSWFISMFFIWLGIMVTYFFRIPRRESEGDDKNVTSVADGQVVIIKETYEGEYLKRNCIQVSVYMNFFDMHANFWPVDGEVTYYKYHPGKHWLAFKPKASEENEHSCTAIRTPDGTEIMFKQLAGTFARRIVNYAVPAMKVRAGNQCGIIKFGSRIDMYLPLDAEIKVETGEVTRACETVIASLR
ncbi:MAG: phosphatidylserine decarboxylase [Bacteroidales bacterium]|nr:phosphatidylserine decarboxylase [Bacteroidales bacterium]